MKPEPCRSRLSTFTGKRKTVNYFFLFVTYIRRKILSTQTSGFRVVFRETYEGWYVINVVKSKTKNIYIKKKNNFYGFNINNVASNALFHIDHL